MEERTKQLQIFSSVEVNPL